MSNPYFTPMQITATTHAIAKRFAQRYKLVIFLKNSDAFIDSRKFVAKVNKKTQKNKKQQRNNTFAAFNHCILEIFRNYFPWCSSETVNFLRPFARREASTRRPFFVDILSRKPWL
jgi:hypothetical protein